MGTDDKGLAWTTLDSLKVGEIYYDSATSETYMGTVTGHRPAKISYGSPSYSIVSETITKEQEQIETLIRAVTNLIKEVEELKKDDVHQYDRIATLEEENKVLRRSMEEMYIEMVAIRDKTVIIESRKADKEEVSVLESCC